MLDKSVLHYKRIVFLIGALVSMSAVAAPCEENFSESGNFFTGKVYKTWADIPDVKFASAYQGAYLYTVKDGWKILQSDKEMGVISAAQSASYANGKVIPLNIAIEKLGAGSKILLTYSTPAGAMSPEDAVKQHFCKTIAAAAGGQEQVSDAGKQAHELTPASNSKAPVNSPRNQNNVAAITQEQQAKIAHAISDKGLKDQRVKQNLLEAKETINAFLRTASCIQNYNGSSLNIYAAPGHEFSSFGFFSPITGTKYHDKNSCLTIVRIQGIAAPALNALRFEVVYLAEDSGESVKKQHELVKQPDGQWLFTR